MQEKKLDKYLWYIILALIVIFKLFLLYLTYYHKHYLVPPGYDSIPHYLQIQKILDTHSIGASVYPGFHLLVIAISKLFHLSIWSVLTNWTPVLILLPSLAMFFLLRQLFSIKVTVLAIAILLITSGYPLYAFIDGNYPDMLAYGFYAPLLFAFLIRYYRTQQKSNLIYAGIFLLLIAFTHHFTLFNVLGILSIFVLMQFFLYLARQKFGLYKKILLGFGVIILLVASGLLLASKLYNGMALNFIMGFVNQKAYLNNSYLNTPLDYFDYANMTGGLVWYLGLVGLLYILASTFTDPAKNKSKQLVVIWVLFLYFFSRYGASGIPARFARELALPLIISLAFLLEFIFEKNPLKNRLGQLLSFGVIGYFLIINCALYSGIDKFPEAYNGHVWFWPLDQQKIDYMAENIPSSSTILYNSRANLFFPTKTKNNIMPLYLSDEQVSVVRSYLDSPQNANAVNNYATLISTLKKEYQPNYIFDDMKAPGNTDERVYYVYAGYQENKKVLEDLARQDKAIKTFDDGAVLYKME